MEFRTILCTSFFFWLVIFRHFTSVGKYRLSQAMIYSARPPLRRFSFVRVLPKCEVQTSRRGKEDGRPYLKKGLGVTSDSAPPPPREDNT